MERITVSTLQQKKKSKEIITALTCYDAFTGRIIDQCGVDVALVGDSLANTRLGYPNTLPITTDEMIHHVKAAARGVSRALLVADMPFQSYETAPWQAAQAAGRFIKEAGAQAVKVEGGRRIMASVKAMLDANIPVMGHLGLTPQSINKDGGYRVKGRQQKEATALVHDARLLEKLGVFAIVLEGVPAALGRRITKSLKIPTIGIGAGPFCDGQILVFDDVVGLSEGTSPKFVKRFANVRPQLFTGIKSYLRDVKRRRFPTSSTSYN